MIEQANPASHRARKDLPPLTSLRFFAAAIVVVFHCGRQNVGEWAGGLFDNGYQAVSFFFVLSGFILTYVYASDSTGRVMRRSFWIARIARICPVYILALLISLPPLIYSAFSSRVTSLPHFIGALFATPLFLQAWFPPVALVWNMPAWSLSVEAFFYLIFPWMIFRLQPIRPERLFLAALAISVVTGFGRTLAMASDDISESAALSNLIGYFPLLHLPQFLVGIAVGRLFLNARANQRLAEAAFILTVGAVTLVFWAHSRLPRGSTSDGVLVPLYALMIYAAAGSAGFLTRVLSHPWIVRLGEASYGIYILHIPLNFWWKKAIKLFHGEQLRPSLTFCLFFLFVIIVSLVVHAWVEKPSRVFLTRWFAGNRDSQFGLVPSRLVN